MATFDRIAELPLEIESCELEGLEFTLGDFERLATIVKLRGGGHEGIGEDVTYDPVDHVALQAAGPPAGLTGSRTFAELSELIGETDLFPAAAPERDVSRAYRRWAFESASLDLALRQAGVNLAAALGREPRPVNFVSSMRLARFGSEEPASIDPLLARLAVYPTLRFKLDPTNDWDEGLIAALVQTGAVDSLDLKGFYKGTPVDVETDPVLYAKLIEAFPDAWLEDPDVNEETKPLLDPVADRVTWDAPIHSVADIESMPWAPKMVNVKPSRFGAVASCSPPTTTARSEGSAPTEAARPSSARAVARSSTWPRSSILTRPTTSPPPATTTPIGRPGPACPPARWSRGRPRPAFDGRDKVAKGMSFAKTLNEQVAYEFAAQQQYIAIAVHYDSETLPQLAAFFYRQALEERNHAMMITQYLLDAGHPIEVPGIEPPRSGFPDTVAPVRLALDQEKRVSEQIANLARLAREEGDYQGEQFMQWFIKEQVEEVSSMSALLKIVERAKENPLLAEEYLAREGVSGESVDPTAPSAAGGAL